MKLLQILFFICMVTAPPLVVGGDFTIQVNFTTSVTPTQQAAFDNAATTWTSLVSGYQSGFVTNRSSNSSYNIGQTIDTLFIDASISVIDGVGGTLGQAGPAELILDNLGFIIASDGSMQFDSDDIANLESNGTLDDVILHEMGHVMGFGTLWTNNGVYSDGTGEFTGGNATAAWQTEFGQSGTPDVELAGGAGTANGHWNENTNGSGPTGITDSESRDMRDELMTGWLNGNSFISNMTLQSFVDIGYALQAVPEPATAGMIGLIIFGWIGIRRRRHG